MRHIAALVSVILSVILILWAGSLQAATLFDGSFVGCTDGNACNTGTGWDTETDTGSDVACDDGDLTAVHIDNRICADVMNDTTVGYLEEDSGFSTENEVYYRFYVKLTDGGTYPASNNFELLTVRNEADNNNQAALRLNATAQGRFTLNVMDENDAASQTFGDAAGMIDPNQWNCIQGHWLASSAPGANDGLHEAWINGRAAEPVTGTDSDTLNWGEVRLGDTSGLDSTPAMTLFLAEAIFDDASLPACNGWPPKPQVSIGNNY